MLLCSMELALKAEELWSEFELQKAEILLDGEVTNGKRRSKS